MSHMNALFLANLFFDSKLTTVSTVVAAWFIKFLSKRLVSRATSEKWTQRNCRANKRSRAQQWMEKPSTFTDQFHFPWVTKSLHCTAVANWSSGLCGREAVRATPSTSISTDKQTSPHCCSLLYGSLLAGHTMETVLDDTILMPCRRIVSGRKCYLTLLVMS